MPWSPFRYNKQLFTNLRNSGFETEVTLNKLITEIKRTIGLVRRETIMNLIKSYEQLGFIKQTEAIGIWKILYWDKDRIFKEKRLEKIKQEEDKSINQADEVNRYDELFKDE